MKDVVILLLTIDNYLNSVKGNLQIHSDRLIQQIRKTLDFHYYEKVDLLDYTAFIQPYELSITMYSMDRNANEVFYQGNDNNLFAGSFDLIEDVEYYQIGDEQEDEFWKFYEQNDEVISKLETDVFIKWFKDCWNQAGGKNVKLPAYFSFHDYDNCLDLTHNKLVSDGDKWF